MDKKLLLDEICRRVMEKLADQEPAADKKKILILTHAHDEKCHKILEDAALAKAYQTECALLSGYACKVREYEALIVYGLTNEALGKVANGIWDDGYTRLLGEALLAGKRIFIPYEEVELYLYSAVKQNAYYRRLEENMQLLLQSNLHVIMQSDLVAAVLKGLKKAEPEGLHPAGETSQDAPPQPENCCESAARSADTDMEAPLTLAKRIITEKDIRLLREDKAAAVNVGTKAILTDLAKEYAEKYHIRILRVEM